MPLSLKDLRPDPGFRPATMADAELLYRWRLEAEEADFYEAETTAFADHLEWLRKRVDNELVQILIWDEDRGMVRIDSNGEVAFHASDTWTAVEMLKAVTPFAESYGGRLKAVTDQRDWRGTCLQKAGFEFLPVSFCAYRP